MVKTGDHVIYHGSDYAGSATVLHARARDGKDPLVTLAFVDPKRTEVLGQPNWRNAFDRRFDVQSEQDAPTGQAYWSVKAEERLLVVDTNAVNLDSLSKLKWEGTLIPVCVPKGKTLNDCVGMAVTPLPSVTEEPAKWCCEGNADQTDHADSCKYANPANYQAPPPEGLPPIVVLAPEVIDLPKAMQTIAEEPPAPATLDDYLKAGEFLSAAGFTSPDAAGLPSAADLDAVAAEQKVVEETQ